MSRYSRRSLSPVWMAVAILAVATLQLGALAFSMSPLSSSSPKSLQQRSRPFSITTRRFDSESNHADWDVLQKKLQQKIQEQQFLEKQQSHPVGDVLPTPNVDYSAHDVVTMCMNHLQDNHVPVANAGLQVCFDFSSDRCRAACGGSLQDFVEYAANPTFGALLYCESWKVLSIGPIIAGTPTRGAMQTVLIEVQSASSPSSTSSATASASKAPKRFLWTLQQERRPPRQGCWLVHEVLFTKNAYSLTM